MSSFTFATASSIIFGAGKLSELPGLVKKFGGTRVFLVRRRAQSAEALADTALVSRLPTGGRAATPPSLRFSASPVRSARDPPSRLSSHSTPAGISYDVFEVRKEPSIELVESGVAAAKNGGYEVIVGFGGGSVLDTGKVCASSHTAKRAANSEPREPQAIAALLTNGGVPLDYLENIGRGKVITTGTPRSF
jgi:alcohol dehydrogenase class IV